MDVKGQNTEDRFAEKPSLLKPNPDLRDAGAFPHFRFVAPGTNDKRARKTVEEKYNIDV